MFVAWGGAARSQAQEPPPQARPYVLAVGAPAQLAQPDGPLAQLYPDAVLATDLDGLIAEQSGTVSAAELAPLALIDALLSEARARAAQLDERSALIALARAERLAQGALALPGAVTFYAEAELQLAITAAQAGLAALAEESLRRAARLSPRRRLLAAEASPDLVALAERVFREAANAPQGEVPIEVDAPGAHVFLDDVEVGVAPTLLRTSVGEHALRVQAPGRVAYGARLEVAEGRRATQRIALAPDSVMLALIAAERAAARFASHADVLALQAAASALALQDPRFVALLAVRGAGERALVIACTAERCSGLGRLADLRFVVPPAGAADDESSRELAAGLSWLDGPAARATTRDDPQPGASVWDRWYVWSGLAVLAVGAGALIAALATPEPAHELRVVVSTHAN